MLYLAEFYLPAGSTLADVVQRVRSGVAAAAAAGIDVAFVEAVHLPDDESCFVLYRAANPADVAAAGSFAALASAANLASSVNGTPEPAMQGQHARQRRTDMTRHRTRLIRATAIAGALAAALGGTGAAYASTRPGHAASGTEHFSLMTTERSAASYVVIAVTTIRLGHGTGKYAGISGTGTATINDLGIAPRTAKGACNLNADPLANEETITATAHVKL